MGLWVWANGGFIFYFAYHLQLGVHPTMSVDLQLVAIRVSNNIVCWKIGLRQPHLLPFSLSQSVLHFVTCNVLDTWKSVKCLLLTKLPLVSLTQSLQFDVLSVRVSNLNKTFRFKMHCLNQYIGGQLPANKCHPRLVLVNGRCINESISC